MRAHMRRDSRMMEAGLFRLKISVQFPDVAATSVPAFTQGWLRRFCGGVALSRSHCGTHWPGPLAREKLVFREKGKLDTPNMSFSFSRVSTSAKVLPLGRVKLPAHVPSPDCRSSVTILASSMRSDTGLPPVNVKISFH